MTKFLFGTSLFLLSAFLVTASGAGSGAHLTKLEIGGRTVIVSETSHPNGCVPGWNRGGGGDRGGRALKRPDGGGLLRGIRDGGRLGFIERAGGWSPSNDNKKAEAGAFFNIPVNNAGKLEDNLSKIASACGSTSNNSENTSQDFSSVSDALVEGGLSRRANIAIGLFTISEESLNNLFIRPLSAQIMNVLFSQASRFPSSYMLVAFPTESSGIPYRVNIVPSIDSGQIENVKNFVIGASDPRFLVVAMSYAGDDEARFINACARRLDVAARAVSENGVGVGLLAMNWRARGIDSQKSTKVAFSSYVAYEQNRATPIERSLLGTVFPFTLATGISMNERMAGCNRAATDIHGLASAVNSNQYAIAPLVPENLHNAKYDSLRASLVKSLGANFEDQYMVHAFPPIVYAALAPNQKFLVPPDISGQTNLRDMDQNGNESGGNMKFAQCVGGLLNVNKSIIVAPLPNRGGASAGWADSVVIPSRLVDTNTVPQLKYDVPNDILISPRQFSPRQ